MQQKGVEEFNVLLNSFGTTEKKSIYWTYPSDRNGTYLNATFAIIEDDNLPRNKWQLGREIETVQNSDGLVPWVKGQVRDQKSHKKQDPPSKPSVMERPIQKLVLLLESWLEINNTLYTT